MKILALQYIKLSREYNETAVDWLSRSEVKSMELKYKGNDRCLKELFLNDINDNFMTVEIIKELTAIKYTSKISNGKVLL